MQIFVIHAESCLLCILMLLHFSVVVVLGHSAFVLTREPKSTISAFFHIIIIIKPRTSMNFNFANCCCCILLVALFAPASSIAENDSHLRKEFVISSYLPDYRIDISKIDFICEKVTDLILFSAEPFENGDISLLNRFPSDFILAVQNARSKHKTRISLCIGGGGRSGAFSTLTASSSARRTFALKLLTLCKDLELDGVDIDWEGDLGLNSAHWKDFEALLREVHELFRMEDRHVLISIAIHVGQEAALTSGLIEV